ncbi:hypothetical protein T484DRAFT_1960539 [Baffinella frigidus]|nr:hypothetical protein T484DRAFT_1960539 [Cryptophyta sp. CCMP2293]
MSPWTLRSSMTRRRQGASLCMRTARAKDTLSGRWKARGVETASFTSARVKGGLHSVNPSVLTKLNSAKFSKRAAQPASASRPPAPI